MAVFAILAVCTGNICRSPLAELVLRDGLAGVPDVEVMSSGTGARPGLAMPDQERAIARRLSLDPDDHRSQRLADGMLEASDLVLTMSRDHRKVVVTSVPRALPRSFTLREFARLAQDLSEDDIISASQGRSAFERMSSVVRFVASRRGAVPAVAAEEDDVVDPYGRSDAVYEQAAEQMLPALAEVIRVLRIAARGAQASARPEVSSVREHFDGT